MKRSVFILLFLASVLQTFAVTNVYVDTNNVAADDANAGSDPALPWKTLNPTKWADDMVLYIANGTYTISTKIGIVNNVTLIGESRTGVILQAMDDAAFSAGTTGNTLFQLSGKTASFRTMTIKNVRDNTLKLGGAFDILQSGNLTLTDITLTKLVSAQSTWSGGGAIMVRGGTLTVDSCIFEACQSNFGGAIMTYTNSTINPNQVSISNSRFINNANPYDSFFTGSHFGGAITFSGKGTFTIDKCYFEGNQSKLNTSNTGGGTGGVIMVRLDAGATSSLNITNSVFYKNESDGAGSVMALGNNGLNASTVFNLNLSNNVIFQNKGNVYSGSAPNTLAFYSGGGVQYTGTFILANNTFFQNYNRANSSSISVEGMPVSVYFVNNLMNDNQSSEVTVWGLSCSSVANSATLRRFKGNIFNHLGGSLSVSDATNYPDLFESNSNSNNGNRSWISNTYQKVAADLTVPATGLPYLETQAGGFGINFGVDEFLVNSVNIVPATDIRGKRRSGVTDAGAFEFAGVDFTTAIHDFIDKKENFMYYNSGIQTLNFNKPAGLIQIFNLNGTCVLKTTNTSVINISGLINGIYLVRVVESEITKTQKFVKL